MATLRAWTHDDISGSGRVRLDGLGGRGIDRPAHEPVDGDTAQLSDAVERVYSRGRVVVFPPRDLRGVYVQLLGKVPNLQEASPLASNSNT